jgi:uncharacterized protein (UPF0335 family)
MPKAATKEKPETVETAAAPSNTRLKEYVKRLLTVNAEIKDFTESRKELLAEAKGNGVAVKELKAAVRIIENPPESEFKDTVNFILEANGQLRFFA